MKYLLLSALLLLIGCSGTKPKMCLGDYEYQHNKGTVTNYIGVCNE